VSLSLLIALISILDLLALAVVAVWRYRRWARAATSLLTIYERRGTALAGLPTHDAGDDDLREGFFAYILRTSLNEPVPLPRWFRLISPTAYRLNARRREILRDIEQHPEAVSGKQSQSPRPKPGPFA